MSLVTPLSASPPPCLPSASSSQSCLPIRSVNTMMMTKTLSGGEGGDSFLPWACRSCLWNCRLGEQKDKDTKPIYSKPPIACEKAKKED